MKKLFILPIFLIIFYSCSYEPILLNKKNDFQFVNISISGDNNINEIIKNELLRNNGPKKYNINLETIKKKQIVSSNEKGDPVVFKLNIDTLFVLIEENEIVLKNTINKQASYNNISDKFELSQYEESIIKNLAGNISNEILMSITNLSK
tara:strand:+ start:315 stop:764 length:450 start_codon:yes stop_codon:yes gene_type:complete